MDIFVNIVHSICREAHRLSKRATTHVLRAISKHSAQYSQAIVDRSIMAFVGFIYVIALGCIEMFDLEELFPGCVFDKYFPKRNLTPEEYGTTVSKECSSGYL